MKYSDGYTEEVYGFDIPVPAIGEEFNVAILGEKGKWYDHKVSVKNPVKTSDDKKSEGKKPEELKLEDGTYETDVTLTGGTGRASVESPAKVEIKDKEATATIIWSSPNYDYMIVDGEKYEPVNKDGNSTFEIPVTVFDAEMEVTADKMCIRDSQMGCGLLFPGITCEVQKERQIFQKSPLSYSDHPDHTGNRTECHRNGNGHCQL